ncbi:MAG: hypothetical protein ABIU05_00770 [Nitrospirales bacterium]
MENRTMEDLNKPDTSEVLNLPKDNLTLDLIRQHLTQDEQRWLTNMVRAYGEQQVLAMWPSYEVQINYVRNL